MFKKKGLYPIVAYNYQYDTEDLFVDEEDRRLVDAGIEEEQKKLFRKKFLLERLNKKISDIREEEERPDH